jgi:hypothetical protein
MSATSEIAVVTSCRIDGCRHWQAPYCYAGMPAQQTYILVDVLVLVILPPASATTCRHVGGEAGLLLGVVSLLALVLGPVKPW